MIEIYLEYLILKQSKCFCTLSRQSFKWYSKILKRGAKAKEYGGKNNQDSKKSFPLTTYR